MNKKLLITLGATVAMLSATATLRAETLLGSNYFGASVGALFFGDSTFSDAFDDAYKFDVMGNFNVMPNLDILIDAGISWADGSGDGVSADFNQYTIGADFNYFFAPGETVNPFLTAGLTFIQDDYQITEGIDIKFDDSNIGMGLGAGVEMETTESVLTRLGLEYITVDSADIINLYGSAGYWFNMNSLGALKLVYDFESENFTAELAYIYKM